MQPSDPAPDEGTFTAGVPATDGGLFPLVSVVMTTYNYGRYVVEAVESVLAQDYPQDRIEIVVVDDGSTDDTSAVLAPYADRIRYIQQANTGINGALDHAFEVATGDVLALLDADDAWMPTKLHRQVEILQARPEVGIVTSDMETMDAESASVLPSWFGAHYGAMPPTGRVLGVYLEANLAPAPTIVFRREHLARISPIPRWVPFHDWWIAVQVLRDAELAMVTEPLTRYRRHEASITDGANAMKNMRRELPYRRWALRALEIEQGTAEDAVKAWNHLEGDMHRTAGHFGTDPAREVPVTGADRRDLKAQLALVRRYRLAGDLESAVRYAVRARACDPFDERAQYALRGLLERLRHPQPYELPADVGEVRGCVGVAFLSELRGRPALLQNWMRAFDAESDTTLLVLSGGANLAWLTARPELAAADAADVLVSELAMADVEQVRHGIDIVISDESVADMLGLPVMGSKDGPATLRAAVEQLAASRAEVTA